MRKHSVDGNARLFLREIALPGDGINQIFFAHVNRSSNLGEWASAQGAKPEAATSGETPAAHDRLKALKRIVRQAQIARISA
jgi:hypothetical protein